MTLTALLPTRVSIYDFLIQDTKPIASLMADIGKVSIPQATIVITYGTQAIVSALLFYNQRQGSEAVLKKLFNRSQVRELRKYNAFNLQTISAAMQYGQSVNDTLFSDVATQKAVSQHLALLAGLQSRTVRPMLATLAIICLRELAILTDFAQLDANEVNTWLQQQPQFLILPRSSANDSGNIDNEGYFDSPYCVPEFDQVWHEMTGYQMPKPSIEDATDNMPHYAKVIGRTAESYSTSIASNTLKVVDTANNSDILTFSSITDIHLPYQRWLLQLAKISDIYLSRNRLKIAPEPKQPPSRPLVSFGFMDEQTTSTASEKPIVYDEPRIFWKNPVLITILAIISGLSILAIGKYQYKKYTDNEVQPLPSLSETVVPNTTTPKDIAIVKISEAK